MGVIERDPYTGQGTTGHEWNGIKELNGAVPRVVWAFMIGTAAFAVVWWILMPAWPLGTTYTKGLLGVDVRDEVASDLRDAARARAGWMKRIETQDYPAIQADPALMKIVRETGHTLFGDNCAACHGVKGAGGPGYPALADGAWLWGGTPKAVFETIRVGVNADDPDSRASQMPAWGRNGALKRDEVDAVSVYVQSLSQPVEQGAQGKIAAGAKVFADYCAACHGEKGKGNHDLGAPDLTDRFWLYGGDGASIRRSIFDGRQSLMPSWRNRISEIDRKILTLYVLDLGRAAP